MRVRFVGERTVRVRFVRACDGGDSDDEGGDGDGGGS